MDFNRRTMLRATAASAATSVALFAARRPAAASAPPGGKQAPGYYRMKVGSFEVTVISDGTLALPPSFWNAPQPEVVDALRTDDRPTDAVTSQLNTLVVNTGAKLVLIDAGTGGKYQNASGTLLANLAAAGFKPGQVDTVVLTHGHPDHLWGLTDATNTRLLFPNAEYVVSEPEFAYWSAPALPGQVPGGMRQMIDTTQQNLKAIEGHTRRIKPGTEILPGLVSVDTPGHTPGHISVQIGSDNEALLVSGDVIVNPTLSFRKPAWGFSFEVDQALAAKTRAAFLDRCAADRTMVASYHLPFPAIGHVVRDGSAYRWLPADWRWQV